MPAVGAGENRRQPGGGGARSRPQPLQMYDERPAVARGSYGFEEEAAAAADAAGEQPSVDTGGMHALPLYSSYNMH